MKQNYWVTSELGLAPGRIVITPFMTKQSAITNTPGAASWLKSLLLACSKQWFRLACCSIGTLRVASNASEESPRNPKESPKRILSQSEWVGLAWGIGSVGWHCCFRWRLPHRSSPAMGGHGPSAHGPESSVSDGSSFEDEAAWGPCSHPLGGGHQRARVGRDVQQMGRGHPWQRRIQVRKSQEGELLTIGKISACFDSVFINWKPEKPALALFFCKLSLKAINLFHSKKQIAIKSGSAQLK